MYLINFLVKDKLYKVGIENIKFNLVYFNCNENIFVFVKGKISFFICY